MGSTNRCQEIAGGGIMKKKYVYAPPEMKPRFYEWEGFQVIGWLASAIAIIVAWTVLVEGLVKLIWGIR